MKKLFTDRYGMTQARVKEELAADVIKGLLSIIKARIDENFLGGAFSMECPDGGGNSVGYDPEKLKGALAAYNVICPEDWPTWKGEVPSDHQLFDLIEFVYEHAGLPRTYGRHPFFGHDHHTYDQEAGRAKFAEDVNRVFERQGLAFELVQGEVTRMAPTGLQEALAATVFATGDDDLNRLLETAREKFLNKSLDVRKEGLEKLWDAWERLKTVEPGRDKKAQAKALLDKATREPNLRTVLEEEAMELTEIGNRFMIRHTETTKTPIAESAHVDYLFHRMFAIMRLLLKSSGRGR